MDIQQTKTRTNQTTQQSKKNTQAINTNKQGKPANKDLLRFERPIYEIKKSEQSQQEYVIRKLMQKKQKPSIGMIGKSPLLSRLQEMMPVFHKSNQELLNKQIQQDQKIDARLEECSSDSESQSSQDDSDNSSPLKLSEDKSKMQVEKTYPSSVQDQQSMDEEKMNKPSELQLNFLTYPYLTQQQAKQIQQKNMAKQLDQAIQKQKPKMNKILIEQIPQQK